MNSNDGADEIDLDLLNTTLCVSFERSMDTLQYLNKPQSTIDAVEAIARKSVLTQQENTWKEYRSQHPFECLNDDWLDTIYLERAILEQVIESRNTDINEWMSKTVFAVMMKSIFGLPFDIDLYHHFHGQSYGVQQKLVYGFTLYPSFYYHRYMWIKEIKRITDTDQITPCLLANIKANKLVCNVDELSGIFWGGMYSVTSTLVTLLIHTTSHPLKRDMLYKSDDQVIKAMIREAMRINPSVPIITRHIDNKDVFVCPYGFHSYVTDPHEFKYERFIDDLSCFQNNYAPFGSESSRYCVGMEYALNIMFIIIKCISTKISVRVNEADKYDTIVHAGSIVPKTKICGEVMFMNRKAHWCYIDAFHSILFKLTHNNIHYGKAKTISNMPHIIGTPRVTYINVAHNILGDNKMVCYHCKTPNTCVNMIAKSAISVLKKVKVDDDGSPWFSTEESHRAIEKIFHVSLNDARISNYKDMTCFLNNMNHTDILKFISTQGLGAHLIRSGSRGYCIDLMHMVHYKVRPKLARYGAKLILDTNFDVIGIKTPYTPIIDSYGKMITSTSAGKLYTPQDKHWLFAYHLFMSSLITHVTLIQHALYCHFKEAGQFLYLFTKYRNDISSSLKSFIRLFLYDTMKINNEALHLLVSRGGLIYRIFAFTEKETQRYLKNHFVSECLPEMLNINTPFWRDYNNYTEKVNVFVGNILNKMVMDGTSQLVEEYKEIMENNSSSLHDILVTHIITVSFWHEHVGNMSWYLFSPSVVKTRIFKEYVLSKYDSRQGTLQGVHLALYTSINKMPTIMSPLETKMDSEFTEDFQIFRSSLDACHFECKHLQPEFFECSVSL